MNAPVKQHLIDPEICIRCHSCEAACPIGAIEHDEVNVVVKADACNFCMSCIPVCPTGSIDNWRLVAEPYSLAEQYSWGDLPPQGAVGEAPAAVEATDETVAALLAEAHAGAEGVSRAPGLRRQADRSTSTRRPSPSRRRCRAITGSPPKARARTCATSSSISRAARFRCWRARRSGSSRRAKGSRRDSIRCPRRATASGPASTTSRSR